MRLNLSYWRGRFVMYRCYDADGRLLYVGSTNNLPRRATEHRAWWVERVDRLMIRAFPSLEAARAAEAVAIQEEQPLANVMGTGRSASDRSCPGWTPLDFARAEEYRTRWIDSFANQERQRERQAAVRMLAELEGANA